MPMRTLIGNAHGVLPETRERILGMIMACQKASHQISWLRLRTKFRSDFAYDAYGTARQWALPDFVGAPYVRNSEQQRGW